MKSGRMAAALAALVTLLASGNAAAVKLQLSDEAFLDVRLLVQPQAQARQDGSADGDGVGSDFYLRRARLILSGNVTKNISFFLDTDAPNYGKGGKYDLNIFFLQDAFASFKIVPELTVDTGLIIAPLTHHTIQSAVSLNTLDYHAFMVKYPAGSNKVWRDVGVQLRGLFLGDRFQYRAGVWGGRRGESKRFDGPTALPDINPNGVPRFAGQVRFNLLDPESDFFFGGTYLRKKKVVSFGVAADYQPKVAATGAEVRDYVALGGDVFVDLPVLQASEIVFQVNAINYWQGDLSPATGLALFAEAGYRWKWLGGVVSYERFVSKTGAGHLQAYHVGLNGWIEGHTANVKADLAFEQDCAAQKKTRLADAKTIAVFTLQTQLFF
ncbi:MAG: hypothetical protein HY901_36735 [Deltaproteobacteria bacterium]|nr:hypothetical protein [Deltaproteobacteria bacterium]